MRIWTTQCFRIQIYYPCPLDPLTHFMPYWITLLYSLFRCFPIIKTIKVSAVLIEDNHKLFRSKIKFARTNLNTP